MTIKHLGRYVYPVRNCFEEGRYFIPVNATHIWVENKMDADRLVFRIYADIVYRKPTPMFCGWFYVDFDFTTGDVGMDIIENDIDLGIFMCRDVYDWVADLIVGEIQNYGEVDCSRVQKICKEILEPRLAESYKKYKETGGQIKQCACGNPTHYL